MYKKIYQYTSKEKKNEVAVKTKVQYFLYAGKKSLLEKRSKIRGKNYINKIVQSLKEKKNMSNKILANVRIGEYY